MDKPPSDGGRASDACIPQDSQGRKDMEHPGSDDEKSQIEVVEQEHERSSAPLVVQPLAVMTDNNAVLTLTGTTGPISQFYRNGKIPRGGNPSFIVLIPKKEGAISLDDFRPISLISSLYKVIAKILANRMKGVMDSIISDNQSAFISGRFILDGVAYDFVEWDYLDVMLDRFNFDSRWRKLIRGCLTSASANVLVNGSPSGEFSLEKGLRQGDPLSPFLFLIAAEGLHSLVERAVEKGFVGPAEIGKDNIRISHLQYADDTVFVLADEEKNAEAIKYILMLFHLISGMSVNFNKSNLMGIGVDVSRLERMAAVLGCNVRSMPFKYLGIKVGGCCKKGGGLLWARVVKSLYGDLEWGEKTVKCCGRGRVRDGWWSRIISVIGGSGESWFLDNICIKVGDGNNTKFWSHKWVGSMPLKFVFPRLYHLCVNKEALISESGTWENGVWKWELSWRRELFERDLRGVEALLSFISGAKLDAGAADDWSWTAAKDGFYSTRSAYEVIYKTRQERPAPEAINDILSKVWKSPVPHKVRVTAWRTLRDRLPTCANLRRRNILVDEVDLGCNACFHNEETIDHFLLHCPKTEKVWEDILRWLGVENSYLRCGAVLTGSSGDVEM
ncbi:uncharacterized protein LOC130990064 [Salvia miltiorrhiza]|uniref:uncharacterized protein LOC130990064 n=1 Tax=Salvia miltiorrhiza TaxID=226208 RepID=UPI0025AB9C07|nr:uncharacterized protein LOC130990064 [Salvia miltiorrhiza]